MISDRTAATATATDAAHAARTVTITLTLSRTMAANLLAACKHAGAAAASDVYGIPAGEVHGGKPDPEGVLGKPDPDVRALDRLIVLNALAHSLRMAMD